MRIVVISDSHGKGHIVDQIIKTQSTAKHIFFLGDLVRDIEDFSYEYTDKTFYIVSGNCDYNSFYPTSDIAKIGDIGIFYTHGHAFGVKGSTKHLAKTAKERNCKIALYGHTHVSHTSYEDGMYIVNPGSVSRPRDGSNASYAVIDIEENGIIPIIIKL